MEFIDLTRPILKKEHQQKSGFFVAIIASNTLFCAFWRFMGGPLPSDANAPSTDCLTQTASTCKDCTVLLSLPPHKRAPFIEQGVDYSPFRLKIDFASRVGPSAHANLWPIQGGKTMRLFQSNQWEQQRPRLRAFFMGLLLQLARPAWCQRAKKESA